MVLMKVVEVDGHIGELLSKTDEHFKTKKEFLAHVKKNGSEYAGRRWQLWSENGTSDVMEFETVTQYKLKTE